MSLDHTQPADFESVSNHDIALEVYMGLMHHITTHNGTYVNVQEVISYLNHIYQTDATPVAVEIRKQNTLGA